MGLYLKKKLENEATIAVWQITETEQELIELSSVPSDEMEEISYIRSESQRKQRLAVRALLSEVFEEKVYLSHHDNGKPYLENMVTNISITHTEKYVAIILHDEKDLGIDLESLDRDFSAVEKRALSEDEIEDLDDERRNEQLAIYWCAKEAIFKRGAFPPAGRRRTGGHVHPQGWLRRGIRTRVHDLRPPCPRLGRRLIPAGRPQETELLANL